MKGPAVLEDPISTSSVVWSNHVIRNEVQLQFPVGVQPPFECVEGHLTLFWDVNSFLQLKYHLGTYLLVKKYRFWIGHFDLALSIQSSQAS